MKEYIVEVDVNGGEYKAYAGIDAVKCAEMLDSFTVLIDDKIKIKFDEKIKLTRVVE